MAKTKHTTTETLKSFLVSKGHYGVASMEQLNKIFGFNRYDADAQRFLLNSFNQGALTGDYSSFFVELSKIDSANYDLRNSKDFDKQLSNLPVKLPGIPVKLPGIPVKLPGIIKESEHETPASKERGLVGLQTLISKNKDIAPIPALKIMAAASYTERLFNETEAHRTYLGKVQKAAVKGSFKEIGQGDLEMSKDMLSFLQNSEKMGFTKTQIKTFLETMRGSAVKTPMVEGKREVVRFNINGSSATSYTNVGLRGLQEAAEQTLSAFVAPRIMQTMGTDKPLFDVGNFSTTEVKLVESLISLNGQETISSFSERIAEYTTIISDVLKCFPDFVVDGKIREDVQNTFINACVSTGAFAATSKEDFLYRATQAATSEQAVSLFPNFPKNPMGYTEYGAKTKEGDPIITPNPMADKRYAVGGLMFADGNIYDLSGDCALPATVRITKGEGGIEFEHVSKAVTQEEATQIASKFAQGSSEYPALSSPQHVSPEDIKLINPLAQQFNHLFFEETKDRVSGYDATSSSGTMGSTRAKNDIVPFSIGLFRNTSYYKTRKQETMAKLDKYCSYMYESIGLSITQSDSSKEVVVNQEESQAETFDVEKPLNIGGQYGGQHSDADQDVLDSSETSELGAGAGGNGAATIEAAKVNIPPTNGLDQGQGGQ